MNAKKGLGILLTLIGIVLIVVGFIILTNPHTNFGMVNEIAGYIGGGIPLLIIGLVIWVRSGRFEPSRKRMKAEITKKEERDKLELEGNIYNYLKSNESRAFTTEAILNQVFSDSPTEALKELVEQTLENLVKQGVIQRTQKDAETFYFY